MKLYIGKYTRRYIQVYIYPLIYKDMQEDI